jgi:hypothetical protein
MNGWIDGLERTRRRLFDRLAAARGPMDWYSLQLHVASAVLKAEEHRADVAKRDRAYLKWHIQLCKAYVDAIAWRTMSAHAIRHHATLPGGPAHLGGIRHELRRYFTLARGFAKQGLPAILPDLSNMLRLGDVVVVVDPSAPEVIEVKGEKAIMPAGLAEAVAKRGGRQGRVAPTSLRLPRRGRAGRQLSQIVARDLYLRNDRGRLPGDLKERVAISVYRESEMLFPEIEAVTLDALRAGFAVRECNRGHVIVAIAADRWDGRFPDQSDAFMARMRYPVFGMNLRPYNDLWWVAPPPT